MNISIVDIITAESTREVGCRERLRLAQQYWRVTEALMLAARESNRELVRQTQEVVAESYALLRALDRSGFYGSLSRE